ncbi:hypothetical protein L5515_018186 [Caenorhabditis briggsae]|uniref:Uncharacterized protein n=1 Tax=Caenorhabditis briggsae TaxID=6238 RepID=A0AAE9FFU3_CAEBR|nr:hypothetical protein L5515_018186 [Caenorhabditis briggsae]
MTPEELIYEEFLPGHRGNLNAICSPQEVEISQRIDETIARKRHRDEPIVPLTTHERMYIRNGSNNDGPQSNPPDPHIGGVNPAVETGSIDLPFRR